MNRFHRFAVIACVLTLIASAAAYASELKVINITKFSCQDVVGTSGMRTVIDRCTITAELEIDSPADEFPIDYVCWFDLRVRVSTTPFESHGSARYEIKELTTWTKLTATQPLVKIKVNESFRDVPLGRDQIMWARLTGAMCAEASAFEAADETPLPDGA